MRPRRSELRRGPGGGRSWSSLGARRARTTGARGRRFRKLSFDGAWGTQAAAARLGRLMSGERIKLESARTARRLVTGAVAAALLGSSAGAALRPELMERQRPAP